MPRSVNTQVVVRWRDRRVLAVSATCWPGNRNDPVVYRATIRDRVAGHPRLIGDGGYRGVDGVTTPSRDSSGRIVRDNMRRRFTRRRATVEHVIARLKDGQILRQCRRHGHGIDHAVAGVAALYNLRLNTT